MNGSPVRACKDWVVRFSAEQEFGTSDGGHQDYFDFQDTPNSHVVVDPSGRLKAVGPVYQLNWPEDHRLVALFILERLPRQLPRSRPNFREIPDRLLMPIPPATTTDDRPSLLFQ